MIDCQHDDKSIFNVARKIASPAARADYLQQACGHDHLLLNQPVWESRSGPAAPAGFQPASCLPPASSRWIASPTELVGRLQADRLRGLQASSTFHGRGRLKAAREDSLKRAEQSLWGASHHHVNVVANKMPAESRQGVSTDDRWSERRNSEGEA